MLPHPHEKAIQNYGSWLHDLPDHQETLPGTTPANYAQLVLPPIRKRHEQVDETSFQNPRNKEKRQHGKEIACLPLT